jgi:hypothetical protein
MELLNLAKRITDRTGVPISFKNAATGGGGHLL